MIEVKIKSGLMIKKNVVTGVYKLLRRHSLVLHLLQDGDDHVKLGSLGWVFVHAEPHELTDMR